MNGTWRLIADGEVPAGEVFLFDEDLPQYGAFAGYWDNSAKRWKASMHPEIHVNPTYVFAVPRFSKK